MPDPSLTPIMMKLIFPLLSLDFPNSSPTKLTLYSLMQHIPIENAYNLPQIVKTTGWSWSADFKYAFTLLLTVNLLFLLIMH